MPPSKSWIINRSGIKHRTRFDRSPKSIRKIIIEAIFSDQINVWADELKRSACARCFQAFDQMTESRRQIRQSVALVIVND